VWFLSSWCLPGYWFLGYEISERRREKGAWCVMGANLIFYFLERMGEEDTYVWWNSCGAAGTNFACKLLTWWRGNGLKLIRAYVYLSARQWHGNLQEERCCCFRNRVRTCCMYVCMYVHPCA